MANGYVRYGNSIHLDGFQILDFCIENAISLESLRDLNLGRKVFLTGNDTNAGYLRENVWDGDRWRATAYLDDIEAITTGEGSLGTRVKALEDMLNVDSAETVVSTWEEIQAFLDNVKEGTDLMTMLDGKLDKTGGTISKDGNPVPLTIKSTGEYAGLGLKIGENGRAVLAYYGGLDWRVTNESYQAEAKILHNLNFESIIGDTYLKTTGGKISGDLDINSQTDTTKRYFRMWYYASERRNRGMMSVNDDSVQLDYYSPTDGASYYIRIGRNGLKYSASYVENDILHLGNVGDYALKIDGSNTMTGNLKMTEGKAILWGSSNLLQYTTSKFIIGRSTSIDERTTEIHGYPIIFRYGNDEGLAMTITDKGNVLVGDTYGENIKFTVKGGASICTGFHTKNDGSTEAVNKPSEINKDYSFSIIRGYDNRYGLHTWIKGDGQTFLQSCMADGEQDGCYALNLNPLGGAVNIGSANSSVYALSHLFASKDLYMGGFIFINHGKEGIYLSGSGINWHNTNDEWSASLLTFAKDSITVKQLANFSGRVLIGGAEKEDGIYLKVKGISKLETLYTYGSVYNFSSDKTSRLTTAWADNIVRIYANNAEGSASRDIYLGRYDGNGLGIIGGDRVLIGGVVADDGETALQVTGLIKVYDSRSKNYVAKYSSTGVQFLLTSGKRNLVSRIDKDGKNIGALAFDSISSDPNTLDYISFRDDTSTWFTINSTESFFNVATTFNGGALIPTGQKLTIGSVTFEEDAAGRVKVDGDMYTTGTLASGGKAKEGTGTGSGSANVRDFELPADGKTTYDCDHLLKSKNVIVQVFEKAIQNHIEVWEMILTDVTIVTEDRVTVTFGRPHNKVHRVHIIGGNVS